MLEIAARSRCSLRLRTCQTVLLGLICFLVIVEDQEVLACCMLCGFICLANAAGNVRIGCNSRSTHATCPETFPSPYRYNIALVCPSLTSVSSSSRFACSTLGQIGPLPLLPPSTLSWMNELVPRARCNVRLAFEGPVVHYMRPLRLSFSPGALVKGAALVLKSEALVPVNLLEESQNRTLLFAGELTVT